MFEGIQFEVAQRLSSAKSVLDGIKESPTADHELIQDNSVYKGVFFVLLYGALEYALTSLVSSTIQFINDQNLNLERLKPRLYSLSLDPQCEGIRNGRSKKWIKQHELFTKLEEQTVFQAESTIFPSERGNIRFKQISFVWSVFDLQTPAILQKEIIGVFETLADNRMAIAHGRMPPQDIGKRYSKEELEKYYLQIKDYCSYVSSCFENYCLNKEFLK